MHPDERREMIVRATVPLVIEHGAGVTTSQVARAAGIGEATIFRVFASKDALLDAVVADVLRSDHAVREIASISLDQPLAARLTEAAEALRAHLERMGAVLGALRASGRPPGRPSREPADDASRRDSFAAIRDAVAGLLGPDRQALRLPPDRLAEFFLGLQLTRARPLAGPGVALPELIDVLLHGALSQGDDRCPSPSTTP